MNSSLTRRQQEVLGLWLDDVPYKELAERLGISPETVNPHLKAIRKKLGAAGISRAALRDASCRNKDGGASGDGLHSTGTALPVGS